MKGYGSEMDVSPPFFWETAGHKHGSMLHRKFMWRDQYKATGCSPALQAVDSKQAENLSVGKTKSYWTNDTHSSGGRHFRMSVWPRSLRGWSQWGASGMPVRVRYTPACRTRRARASRDLVWLRLMHSKQPWCNVS